MMNSLSISDLLQKSQFTDDDIFQLLSLTDPEQCQALYQEAFNRTTQVHGNNVYFRGLIELSNICIYDCRYCGIRKNNHAAQRYSLSKCEILDAVRYSLRAGYRSVALQSGERNDPKFIAFIEDVISSIHKLSVDMGIPQGCGITLSFGEQTPETYARWAAASGNPKAIRYLLRIETSNQQLFAHLHSAKSGEQKTWSARIKALQDLRKLGYQVGTGVMIGIPGQSISDLVNDIRTFERLDIDMLGMGPYLISQGGSMADEGMLPKQELLRLTRNMLATTRLVLPTVNMAAATALETLHPGGRILGIMSGCNVMMPNVTPQRTRASYQLYDNKQGTEASPDSNVLLEKSIIEQTGRSIGFNLDGSALHYRQRNVSA